MHSIGREISKRPTTRKSERDEPRMKFRDRSLIYDACLPFGSAHRSICDVCRIFIFLSLLPVPLGNLLGIHSSNIQRGNRGSRRGPVRGSKSSPRKSIVSRQNKRTDRELFHGVIRAVGTLFGVCNSPALSPAGKEQETAIVAYLRGSPWLAASVRSRSWNCPSTGSAQEWKWMHTFRSSGE